MKKYASDNSEFLSALAPSTPGEWALASAIATGLVGGPLAASARESLDPALIRNPHHIKVYLKKKRQKAGLPLEEEGMKMASLEKKAFLKELLKKFTGAGEAIGQGIKREITNPHDLGVGVKRMLMAGAFPLSVAGLYQIYKYLGESQENAKIKAKLQHLERGAIPQLEPKPKPTLMQRLFKSSAYKEAYVDGMIEKLAQGNEDTNILGDVKRGILNYYLPALALTGGLGAVTGLTVGRQYWKPAPLKIKHPYEDPMLDVNYIDPDTGKVWGGYDTSNR